MQTLSTLVRPPLHAGTVVYLPALTGLRGFAASWVAVYHFWQFLGSPGAQQGWPLVAMIAPIACGYFAVDLFFVLSGFLLGLPYAQAMLGQRPWPSLRQFWLRRCRRVLPAYWMQLAILFSLALAFGTLPPKPLLSLISHALLILNFFPLEVASASINGVYWSLPVEWDFYLILPLFALLLSRVRWGPALLLIFALALGWRYLCYTTVALAQAPALIWWWAGAIQQLPARLDQFFLGVLAAWMLLAYPYLRWHANRIFASGVALLLALIVFEGARAPVIASVDVPLAFVHFSLLALAFAWIMLGTGLAATWAQGLLGGSVLRALGTISYSLYLWHYPVLQAAAHVGIFAQPLRYALLCSVLGVLPLCLLIATLSWRWLERPFMPSAAPKANAGCVPELPPRGGDRDAAVRGMPR